MKRFIAEFEKQSFTQIIFPHKNSDWAEYLKEAQDTFVKIIENIRKYQKCVIVCDNIKNTKKFFKDDLNLEFIEYQTDDTWARDISAISIEEENEIKLLDFSFNAWGGKFTYDKDNAMNKNIAKHYKHEMKSVDIILEGGAIESNGVDTILARSTSIFNKNRNKNLPDQTLHNILKEEFGVQKILYLKHGYLAGDDTDAHIDTLARFVSKDTIFYVDIKDEDDEHFQELDKMRQELQLIATKYNYTLVPLPMPEAIYFRDERLPATYANFLFINGAILVPTYGAKEDKEAIEVFKNHFKDKDIIPIDCSTLIKQHGSLHCVTMNFA